MRNPFGKLFRARTRRTPSPAKPEIPLIIEPPVPMYHFDPNSKDAYNTFPAVNYTTPLPELHHHLTQINRILISFIIASATPSLAPDSPAPSPPLLTHWPPSTADPLFHPTNPATDIPPAPTSTDTIRRVLEYYLPPIFTVLDAIAGACAPKVSQQQAIEAVEAVAEIFTAITQAGMTAAGVTRCERVVEEGLAGALEWLRRVGDGEDAREGGMAPCWVVLADSFEMIRGRWVQKYPAPLAGEDSLSWAYPPEWVSV